MRHYYVMPLLLLLATASTAQHEKSVEETVKNEKVPVKATLNPKVLFGTASYYADKFNGRQTANGESYDHKKPTAACNAVPLGTWIRVTNMQNKRSVVVRVNDRLHPRMKRIVDLSRSSAERLGYTSRGLASVKVEIIGLKKPKATAVVAYK